MKLRETVKKVSDKYYIQSVFSPRQNFAVYGVPNELCYIQEIKKALSDIGANKFRLVKNQYGFAIVCFHYNKED